MKDSKKIILAMASLAAGGLILWKIKFFLGILAISATFVIPPLGIFLITKKSGGKKAREAGDEKLTFSKFWWKYFKELAAVPVAWYVLHFVIYLIFPDVAREIRDYHWNCLMAIEISAPVLTFIVNKRIFFEERYSRKLLQATYVAIFAGTLFVVLPLRLLFGETVAKWDRFLNYRMISSRVALTTRNIEKLSLERKIKPQSDELKKLHKKAEDGRGLPPSESLRTKDLSVRILSKVKASLPPKIREPKKPKPVVRPVPPRRLSGVFNLKPGEIYNTGIKIRHEDFRKGPILYLRQNEPKIFWFVNAAGEDIKIDRRTYSIKITPPAGEIQLRGGPEPTRVRWEIIF